MSNKILLIDSDPIITQMIEQQLVLEGFDVDAVQDGELGLKKALNQDFAVIVLELMLPSMNGFEIIMALREFKDTPVLVLTARSDALDQLLSMDIGADDYLQKPCSVFELLSRLRTIIRRAQRQPNSKPVIQEGPIIVDSSKRHATLDGNSLELTNAEFNILEILIKSPGQAFSKEELTEYALGRKFTAFDRSIDVHISNLRNKLGQKSNGEDWLKTVRGFGYSFNK